MNNEFKIIIASNDSKFSIDLTNECHKYGFNLAFIDDYTQIDDETQNDVIAVMVVDLDDDINILEFCTLVRENYGLPIFGVINKLNSKIQKQAKENGLDLIFTKKMLLNSIREVVIHVSK